MRCERFVATHSGHIILSYWYSFRAKSSTLIKAVGQLDPSLMQRLLSALHLQLVDSEGNYHNFAVFDKIGPSQYTKKGSGDMSATGATIGFVTCRKIDSRPYLAASLPILTHYKQLDALDLASRNPY